MLHNLSLLISSYKFVARMRIGTQVAGRVKLTG